MNNNLDTQPSHQEQENSPSENPDFRINLSHTLTLLRSLGLLTATETIGPPLAGDHATPVSTDKLAAIEKRFESKLVRDQAQNIVGMDLSWQDLKTEFSTASSLEKEAYVLVLNQEAKTKNIGDISYMIDPFLDETNLKEQQGIFDEILRDFPDEYLAVVKIIKLLELVQPLLINTTDLPPESLESIQSSMEKLKVQLQKVDTLFSGLEPEKRDKLLKLDETYPGLAKLLKLGTHK